MGKIIYCKNDNIIEKLSVAVPFGSRIAIIQEENALAQKAYYCIERELNKNYRIKRNVVSSKGIPTLQEIEKVIIPEDTKLILTFGARSAVNIAKFLGASLNIACSIVVTDFSAFIVLNKAFVLEEFVDTYYAKAPDCIFVCYENLDSTRLQEGIADISSILFGLFDLAVSHVIFEKSFSASLIKREFAIIDKLIYEIASKDKKEVLIKTCLELSILLNEAEDSNAYMSGALQAMHAYVMKNRNEQLLFGDILIRFVKEAIVYYDNLFKGCKLPYLSQIERLDIITSFGVNCISSDKKLVPLNKFDICLDERKFMDLFFEIKKRIQLLLLIAKEYVACTKPIDTNLFFCIAPDIDTNYTVLTLGKLIS